MGTAIRFRGLLVTSKYGCVNQRSYSIPSGYSFLRSCNVKKPKNLAEIPDIKKFWTQYNGMKIAENNFKKLLLDELINECQIKTLKSPLHYFEKIVIIHSNIGTLIKQNLVPSVNSVFSGLLSQLESFPFDITKIKQNENELHIKDIRNAVEKQYLAYKYKVDLENIEEILYRYRLCLFEFRSIGNLKRNIDALEKLPRTSELHVAEKIYHINQKPFNVDSIAEFQDTVAELNWQLFPEYCPKILQHSHQYLLFVISILRDMNFTEKQIQEGFPFLYLTFQHFTRRLNYLLSYSDLAKYRNEDKFLHLLSFKIHVLQDLVAFRKASFIELTELISVSSINLTPRIKFTTAKSISYHINKFFSVGNDCTKELKKHPKYKLVSEKEIHDTLTFLKSKNFKDKEVAESVTIVIYPRRTIERTLAKIESEAENLKKYGFKNGCVDEETNYFQSGTKERKKILQLCLYYIEKPYHFSGNGIWDNEINSELDALY